MTNNNSNAKIDDVQVLRACAILMVITYHARVIWPYIPESFQHGFTGVNLFFVISGFVITRSSIESASTMSFPQFWGTFMLKRLFRIVPAAGIWLLIYYGAFLLVNANLISEIRKIVTLTYNYQKAGSSPFWLGHYWSLIVEEHFYIVFALILPFIVKRKLVVPFCMLLIVITIIFLRPFAANPSSNTQAQLDYFATGILIAYFGNAVRTDIPRYLLMAIATTALVALFVLFAYKVHEAYTVCMILAAIIVAIGAADQNIIFPIPILRTILIWIGERSYSIYLSQSLVIYAEYWFSENTRWGIIPAPLRIIFLLCLIFLSGHASYLWIEINADKLRKKLLLWIERRRTSPTNEVFIQETGQPK